MQNFKFKEFNRLARSICAFIKAQPKDLYRFFARGSGWDTIFEPQEVTNDLELFSMFCAAGFVENSWSPPRTFKVTPLFIEVVSGYKGKMFDEIICLYRSIGYKRGFDLSHLHRILTEVCADKSIKKYGEIGSHIGSSMSVAALSNPDLEIFCYDLPNGHSGGQFNTDYFHKRMRDTLAPERIKIFHGNSHSEEIKCKIRENAPYDVFLIDGDHTASGCLEDFQVVFDLVKKGGKIVIDDLIHHPKLERLFDSLVKEYNLKSEKIMSLTDEDERLSLSLRGVGIIYR